MKKLLMMAVMAFALAPCFSDTLTIPDGNGGTKTLGTVYGHDLTEYEKSILDMSEDAEDAYSYSLEDANNDGYLDIVESNCYWNGGGFNSHYCRLYMYNPETRKFEKAEHDGYSEGNDLFEDLKVNGDGTITTNTNFRVDGDTIYAPVAEYKWTGSKWHCYKKYDF